MAGCCSRDTPTALAPWLGSTSSSTTMVDHVETKLEGILMKGIVLKGLKGIIVMVFPLILAASAPAATYYVRPAGNNNNSCTTATTDTDVAAKAAPQNAISCLNAGDTMLIHAGTYCPVSCTDNPGASVGGTDGSTTNASGTSSSPITMA